MIDKRHLRWAYQALCNYAAYRVNGPTSKPEKVKEEPPPWPKGLVPDLDDLYLDMDSWDDLDHGDYLLVRTQIAMHCQENPQDSLIGEFLSHTLYMRQCPESFRVTAPFQRVKRGLGKEGATGAIRAASQLLKRVAMAKLESEENDK